MGDSSPHAAARFLFLSLVLLASIWLCACRPDAASRTLSDAALAVYIRANDEKLTQPSVANRLQAAGLITDATLFRRYLRYRHLDTNIQAGEFELSPKMSMMEIALRLQHGYAAGTLVTIPEGWRAEQIAEMLTRMGIMDGTAFLQMVKDGATVALRLGAYDFLDDMPPGASLEGYLFPDTYELPEKPQLEDLLRRMLDNFQRRAGPLLAGAPYPDGLTAHQVLTLASIVEREAVLPEERPLIAGVYLNRLRQGMRLEADPTVQYAMGYQPATGRWWKTPVSLEEYAAVNSPYNTYLHRGLPPGPICNPGLDAIKAVLVPERSDYLYFVARGDGSHVFARTYEKHVRNVRKYLGR